MGMSVDLAKPGRMKTMPRRKLVENEPREAQLRIELSDATAARLAEEAGRQRCSVAELVRFYVREGLAKADEERAT